MNEILIVIYLAFVNIGWTMNLKIMTIITRAAMLLLKITYILVLSNPPKKYLKSFWTTMLLLLKSIFFSPYFQWLLRISNSPHCFFRIFLNLLPYFASQNNNYTPNEIERKNFSCQRTELRYQKRASQISIGGCVKSTIKNDL